MSFEIAIFGLNQWALDFEGNYERIKETIKLAENAGAAYRAGPELELCGYSLEDAFYEQDTVFHCWSSLLRLMSFSSDINMIVDIGMPVFHSNALYNCRVITYKGKILCIRAKTSLAREGNYRESRHFTAWDRQAGITAYKLPSSVSATLDQDFVPFGANYILEIRRPGFNDLLRIGWEICQELWDVNNVSSELYGTWGCHLIINSSASYWELRKLDNVNDIIKGISLRGGACYAFSNLVGCDGQRYVFYGRSCIYDRGQLVATSNDNGRYEQIQMVLYSFDPKDINEYRAQMGIRSNLPKNCRTWTLLNSSSSVCHIDSTYNKLQLETDLPITKHRHSALNPRLSIRFEQEIHKYVPLWLWDYLRRSRMKGFMIPLSGGLDSSTVAMLVFAICKHLTDNGFDDESRAYLQTVHNLDASSIVSPQDICKCVLKCCYLSTKYSSVETRSRATLLSKAIGAEFLDKSLDGIYMNFKDLLNDGKASSDVTLLDQNLQARLRMTATYYLSGGNRIVLATGNVDEAIMGYLTKYDCSAADINPIGGLCKDDLKSYLRYCCDEVYDEKNPDITRVLREIIDAPPSAELTGSDQRDEDEIGLTYDEISVLGKVRRGVYACSGPSGAFEFLWRNRLDPPFSIKIRCLRQDSGIPPSQVAPSLAKLIKRFYQRYSNNRHKLTVLTPALHAETYSPDDNRYDHRHFLYAPWTEQFKAIDKMVEHINHLSGSAQV